MSINETRNGSAPSPLVEWKIGEKPESFLARIKEVAEPQQHLYLSTRFFYELLQSSLPIFEHFPKTHLYGQIWQQEAGVFSVTQDAKNKFSPTINILKRETDSLMKKAEINGIDKAEERIKNYNPFWSPHEVLTKWAAKKSHDQARQNESFINPFSEVLAYQQQLLRLIDESHESPAFLERIREDIVSAERSLLLTDKMMVSELRECLYFSVTGNTLSD
jgi:hypothetical protein